MTSPENQASSRIIRRLPQIGLLSLLLMTACAAVWCGVWIASREVMKLQSQLMQTRLLSRELVIKDRALLSVVRQDEMFFDENIWHVFVPRDGMKIHLATTGVDYQSNSLIESEVSGELKAGQHNIELKVEESGEAWLVSIDVDMEQLIQLRKDKAWYPNRGSYGGADFDRQQDFEGGKRAVLFRRVFSADLNGKLQPHPDGNGVVMWIE